MNALIADVAVASVPNPVPVVVEAITREWLHRRGARPQVVIDTGWDRFFRSPTNRVAPLVAQPSSQIDLSNQSLVDLLDSLDHSFARTALCTVLHDAVVFSRSFDKLLALPPIVRARLLDVDVFARLAAPDSHEGVPVVGSRDGDGIDGLVIKQLAKVCVSLRLRQTLFVHLRQAPVKDPWIDIAQPSNLRVREPRKAFDVITSSSI